jgi:ferredoxin
MRVSVDQSLCVAHGQCEYNDPEHFTVNDDGVLELDENQPDSAQENVLRGVSVPGSRAIRADLNSSGALRLGRRASGHALLPGRGPVLVAQRGQSREGAGPG